MNYFSTNNVPIPDAAFEHHRKFIAAWMESGEPSMHMGSKTFMAGLLPSEQGEWLITLLLQRYAAQNDTQCPSPAADC
jgi:hypothetical protein